MTITFQCPKCGRLCAFADGHAGKRARCTTCQQVFIIPSEDGQKARKIEADRGEPLAGFYRVVFVDSWKAFANLAGITGFVFVAAAMTFKFFLRDVDYSFTVPGGYVALPLGWLVTITAWGCLFWYYMEIIRFAAFDEDTLPEVDIDTGERFGILWNIFKSIYLFIVAVIVAELPFVVIITILRKMGLEWPGFFRVLLLAGLFSFPMVVLTLSTGPQLWMVFRPDYIWVPIVKAFKPYLVVAGLVMLAAVLQWFTIGYSELPGRTRTVVGLHLAANIGVQIIAIIAMRSVGLFYRHNGCYFPW